MTEERICEINTTGESITVWSERLREWY